MRSIVVHPTKLACSAVPLQAAARGLIKSGDRVVVSQCPRLNDRFPCMAEAGVVKILTIGSDGQKEQKPVTLVNPLHAEEDLV